MKRFFLILLIWLLNISAVMAEEVKRIAVLEFRGVGIDPEILLKLSDQSRVAGVEILPKGQYSVMTRENMVMILNDMGKDASCMEGSCEVEIGRNIGADYVVTGNIMKVDAEYLLTLKLHDTASGELLAGKELRKAQVLDLVDETREMSTLLYRSAFGLETEQKKFNIGKALFWTGSGLLVASGATAGIAYKTKNDYLDAEDMETAKGLQATNRVTGISFPILLGLSATAYTIGWFSVDKEEE